MWANRSGCSPKMSYHERFPQVAQRKWAIVSESLRSLAKNERMSESRFFWVNRSFFEWIAHSLIFGPKTSNSLRNPMSEFPALIGSATIRLPVANDWECYHQTTRGNRWLGVLLSDYQGQQMIGSATIRLPRTTDDWECYQQATRGNRWLGVLP